MSERNPQSDEEEHAALIDRLVDGEVTGDERRELLKSFDEAPGAWRECALAFLEAQALREQLGQFAEDVAPRHEVRRRVSESPVGSYGVWWAVAASALVAFTLGSWLLRPADTVDGPAPPIVANVPSDPVPEIDAPVVEPPDAALADGGPPDPRLGDESLVLWVNDAEGRRQSLRAPLLDADAINKRFGVALPSSVPAETRQRLEGNGFRLSTRRRYAPLFLENGQPLVVPVEDVQVVPVRGTEL